MKIGKWEKEFLFVFSRFFLSAFFLIIIILLRSDSSFLFPVVCVFFHFTISRRVLSLALFLCIPPSQPLAASFEVCPRPPTHHKRSSMEKCGDEKEKRSRNKFAQLHFSPYESHLHLDIPSERKLMSSTSAESSCQVSCGLSTSAVNYEHLESLIICSATRQDQFHSTAICCIHLSSFPNTQQHQLFISFLHNLHNTNIIAKRSTYRTNRKTQLVFGKSKN